MKLKIVTPTGVKYEGEVSRVQFPAATGLAEILSGHDKMIAAVRTGRIITDVQEFDCNGGVLKVENDNITVVCE
ncbi:MAG: F0F1 ATP synthase subunit epsilon [Bacteroidaceae bacterium]|nr:F0F1 ATP synthase subunit epsilon [Bacteroidaceae bacterium]